MNPNHITAVQQRLARGDDPQDIADIFGYTVEEVNAVKPKKAAPKKKAAKKK